jgi:hypothetical protein
MAYLATGFTPEEEAELLAGQRKQVDTLASISTWIDKQETIRTITTVSIVAGLIYTLAQMGNLVAQVRARKKGST